jgi:hypothetical protein
LRDTASIERLKISSSRRWVCQVCKCHSRRR